jgi:NAD(P)H-hydrate epimerase
MYAVTAAQMRRIEDKYIHDFGIPSVLLMENAAAGIAGHVTRLAKPGDRIAVVCGPGNNGGDGLATARLLFTRGMDVHIVLTGEPGAGEDARANLAMVKSLNIPITASLTEPAGILVDALFGTGLSRSPEGIYAEAIQAINRSGKIIVSADIPSGFCSDTGRMLGKDAVRAHATVTFGFPKAGLYLYPCAENTGGIYVENISIPHTWDESSGAWLKVINDGCVKASLPVRKPFSNKGDYGRVCVIAGSPCMPGAAALCCTAAYRAGAGLVDASVHPDVAKHIHQHLPEAIASQNAEESLAAASVVLLGPGLGLDKNDLLTLVFDRINCPLVLDADGLNILAAHESLLERLRQLPVPCVITPHPGEMSRLAGLSVKEILRDPIGVARDFARKHQAHVLLKGARTVIAAPNGNAYLNITGGAALAKAGSGDVLAGIIAGLVAQGMDVFKGASCAAYLHGKAGEVAGMKLSEYGVLARDVVEALPEVMGNLVGYDLVDGDK